MTRQTQATARKTSPRRPSAQVNVPPARHSVTVMSHPDQAEQVARQLLAEQLPRRWAHTQGAAAAARTLSAVLGEHAGLLTAAAWLHDIGYSPALARTGLHQLDGARHLRDSEHASDMLCRLVAHHTCAINEAAERGLAADLAREFPGPPGDLADALTYCDMTTTSPGGAPVPVGQRLAEICARYGPGHTVARTITKSAPLRRSLWPSSASRIASPNALPALPPRTAQMISSAVVNYLRYAFAAPARAVSAGGGQKSIGRPIADLFAAPSRRRIRGQFGGQNVAGVCSRPLVRAAVS
jgi:HD domain